LQQQNQSVEGREMTAPLAAMSQIRQVEVVFRGRPEENVEDYIARLESEGTCVGYSSQQMARLVCSTTRDRAFYWYRELPDETKFDWLLMKEALRSKFGVNQQDFSHMLSFKGLREQMSLCTTIRKLSLSLETKST
jgi:hypothetical protein